MTYKHIPLSYMQQHAKDKDKKSSVQLDLNK